MGFLLKFEKDWADEFDVYGLRILSDIEWRDFQEAIKRIKYPIELYFGTNEALIFESEKVVLQSLAISELGYEEEITFIKYLCGRGFGWTPVNQLFDHARRINV